jgi:hypothetical protein
MPRFAEHEIGQAQNSTDRHPGSRSTNSRPIHSAAAVLALQRSAGNAVVRKLIQQTGTASKSRSGALKLQRCGPAPCDCSKEERDEYAVTHSNGELPENSEQAPALQRSADNPGAEDRSVGLRRQDVEEGREAALRTVSTAQQADASAMERTATTRSNAATVPSAEEVDRLTVQRGPSGQDQCAGAGAHCAAGGSCAAPDPVGAGSTTASTRWELEVNIDVESESLWDAVYATGRRSSRGGLGHTYVRFFESNGREYTFGFYPASELPNPNRQWVPGCVHHPDLTHDRCIDRTVAFVLTPHQYQAGLAYAQNICRAGHQYGPTYSCTSFASDVALAAGQALPSSRSAPMTVLSQGIPPLDNPNTLMENTSAPPSSPSWIRARVEIERGALRRLPTADVIRMLSVLLDHVYDSRNIDAIETLCRAVETPGQMARIRAAVQAHRAGLRRPRIRAALDRI